MKKTLVVLALLVSFPAMGYVTNRDPHQRVAFMKQHPCPKTGKTYGACKGFVVDHVIPLCAGGPDLPSNMQWQTRAQARVKDRQERKQCAR